MTKLLLNFLLIYAIITVITAILIIWRGRKDRDVILIIAGASAIAIGLFYLFYAPQTQFGSVSQSIPQVGTKPETVPEEHRSDRDSEPERTASSEPKGPFPINETVSEKERQVGRLFNIWRRAVLTRNISQINQLDSQIKACGDETIPFLTKLAREDGNERIRAFAVRILGRQNKADLAPLFTELLQNDTSAFVRENSCWSLGRLGNTSALEILQKAADSDASAPVRQAAAQAIETIKSSAK